MTLTHSKRDILHEDPYTICTEIRLNQSSTMGFPGGSEVKAYASNTGNLGSIPGLGRSPGEGNGNPLQYSCLENPWTEEPGGLQSIGLQRVGHD